MSSTSPDNTDPSILFLSQGAIDAIKFTEQYEREYNVHVLEVKDPIFLIQDGFFSILFRNVERLMAPMAIAQNNCDRNWAAAVMGMVRSSAQTSTVE